MYRDCALEVKKSEFHYFLRRNFHNHIAIPIGAGIPAFYTPTGVNTVHATGNFPVKYNPEGSVQKYSSPKEERIFDGRTYVMEKAIKGDVACIKAWKGDTDGNLVFKATAQNFNPDMAKAAKVTVAEIEELVDAGELKPEEIHLPGIFVDRVYVGEHFLRRIEKKTYKNQLQNCDPLETTKTESRKKICRRVANEFKDGMCVNLGIGIPTLVSNYIEDNLKINLHSENGLLKYDYPESEHDIDPDLGKNFFLK